MAEQQEKRKNPFYGTTASEFGCTYVNKGDKMPMMDELLKRKDELRKAKPVVIDNAQYVYTNSIRVEEESMLAEKVLSAHVIPKRFPVDAERLIYPDPKETNPLFVTSNQIYGGEPPKPHQIAESFFPKSNKWTGQYTCTAPRDAGLNTVQDKHHFEF